MPPNAQVSALVTQAARLRQIGRLADSIQPLRQAARLDSSNFAIQHDLGLACLECGQLPEAVAALQRAVAAHPRAAKAFWRLGIALQQQSNVPAAIEAYRSAVRLLPSLADAQFRLASLLEGLGYRTEAIGCYRKAASSAAGTSLGRIAGARASLAENRDQDAERLLRQTLALDPENAVAQEMLGNVLADSGRFEEARGHFERALARDPHLAGTYYDLVRCARITDGDAPLIKRMQAALDERTLEDGQRLKLLLALGKAADDLGAYQEAMSRFDAADTLRRSMIDFDAASFEARVDRLIEWFSPALFERHAGSGSTDLTPVMVLGMPRSGTTLVEQILSSHPGVQAGGELHFWNRRGAMMEQAGVASLNPAFLRELASDYLQFMRLIAPRAERITDKMPMNFLWAGLVHLAFPGAAIVHCRRNPVATALSIHQTHFSPRLGFPTGGADLVAYYRSYERLMAHWRRVLPTGRFLEIDYESLTEAPEDLTRRMIACTGVAWDDACLHPERNGRIIKTASKWQARQPINRASVDRWHRYEPFLGKLAALRP
jgi:tetratricopeptide (TPR) repeat protein